MSESIADEAVGSGQRMSWLWLTHALLYVSALSVAVRYVPLRQIRTALDVLVRRVRLAGDPASLPRALRALETASGWIPGGGNCLVRALTLQALLAHRGIATDVFVGFVGTEGGPPEGHAWLEYEGRVLVGAIDGLDELRTYSIRY